MLSLAVSALLAVESDPLGRSAAEIRGPGLWTYRVLPAPSRDPADPGRPSDHRRSVRAASWLYRWHERPTISDWRSCCKRFDLSGLQEHTLQKYDHDGYVQEEYLVALDFREDQAFVTVVPANKTGAQRRPVEVFTLTDLSVPALFAIGADPSYESRD